MGDFAAEAAAQRTDQHVFEARHYSCNSWQSFEHEY